MLNTYIHHQLPPTCYSVCYTIFMETIALLAQKLYDFLNVAVKILYIYIQGVPGGMCHTSGECSFC